MDIQTFLAQLINRNNRTPEKFTEEVELKQIITKIAGKVSERAAEFATKLFEHENIRKVNLFEWTYPIPNPSQSPICSKIMSEKYNITSFRCFDCMESSSSCICGDCFIEGDHQGHNYLQYGAVNGCCDCGNAQAWNEKGFCKTHASINNSSYQISQSTQKQYIQEGMLLLYIYFYLLKKAENKKGLQEQYGTQLFKYYTELSHECYEMKLLASQLMQQKFPEEYPFVPFKNNNILEIFFRLAVNEVKAYSELNNWMFEIFPVESFRKLVIKEYFQKTKRIGDRMTSEHPLGGLNFQFLSCVKLIINMIKSKELQPLELPPLNISLLDKSDIYAIPNLFKKYYEDLDYINNMKSAKDYHKLHLTLTNITNLALYRELCKPGNKLPIRPDFLPQYNVDEMFIKSFAKFTASILTQKELIIKCLTELFHYIFNTGENLASMAQERAFAMLVLAYFDGDINKLFQNQIKNNFVKSLMVSPGQFQMMLDTIIRATLQTGANILNLPPSEKTPYQQYYLRANLQKNVLPFLDIMFQKILILLSQDVCPYHQIVLQEVKLKLQKLQQSQISNHQTLNKEKNNSFIQTLLFALNSANNAIRIEMDEVVISNMIGLPCKQKVFDIYARILSTYKQLNPKELKNLCLEIVNNQELFEQFVTTETTPEKSKLKLRNNETTVLQHIIYSKLFKNYSVPLPENEVSHLSGEEVLFRFKEIPVYHSQLISIAIEKCMELISNLADESNATNQHLLNSLTRQILKIYLCSHHQQHKYFFCTLLNPSLRVLLEKPIIEQITILQKKEEELAHDLQRIKSEQAEQFKKKREKIANKRKLKQGIIKKNQEQMLSKFSKEVEEIKSIDEQKKVCIYCLETSEENNKEPLSLLAYVGITNLIEKSLLKENQFHYFFSSCGHLIHASCYQKVNEQIVKKYCFLCKQEANILLPEITLYPQKTEKVKQMAEDFLGNIISSLIDDNQMEEGKIGCFQNKIFDQNLELFIISIAKELVYNALHDITFFKKKMHLLILQFFEILTLINKESLTVAFENISKIETKEDKHKLEVLTHYILLKLEQLLLGKNKEETIATLTISAEEKEQIGILLNSITHKNKEIQFKELKQINLDTLFIKLPENLSELHQYMGKCKICPNITNSIFLCLICGWSACIKCSKLIFKHVFDEHCEGAIVIGCSSGSIKYFKGANRIFEDSSIYQNYLGLSFSDAETYAEFGKAQKYMLNKQKQTELHKLMMQYMVHQKIQINQGK